MLFWDWWGTIDWGDAAGWVSGIATTGALVFAVVQLRLELLRRRSEAHSSQASQVTAWFDMASNSIFVRNDSGAVIYDVFVVLILNNPDDWSSFRSQGREFCRLARVVPPRTTVRTVLGQGWAGMSAVPYAKVTFRDAKGITWTRSTSGGLHEDDEDVYAKFGLDRPYGFDEFEVMG